MWAHLGSRREQQGNFQGSFPLCTPWKWWKKSVLSKCKEFRNWFEMFNINIHLQAFICTYIHTWVIEVFLSIWKWKHKAITFGARGNTGTCCRENMVLRRISKLALPCSGHCTTKLWLEMNFLITIHLRHKITGIFNQLRLFSSKDWYS